MTLMNACMSDPWLGFRSTLIPVVVLSEVSHAVPLAHALLEGGVDVMEITLRSSVALKALEEVARHVPEMHVAAGTVLEAGQIDQVRSAGASLALSPGCTPPLLEAARQASFPLVPGVMTPSEVMYCRGEGFMLQKLFPAEPAGGVAMLKALHGPLPDVRFCPTGGIGPQHLDAYLRLPNVAMVGGSWLTPPDALKASDWDRITRITRQAMQLVAQVSARSAPWP